MSLASSLVFLDLETTGTRTTRDRITEITASDRADVSASGRDFSQEAIDRLSERLGLLGMQPMTGIQRLDRGFW